MYERILLPTDGSPGAEAAIDHAVHMAARNDAVIHAVHVTEVTELGDITEEADRPKEDLRRGATDLLTPIHEAATDAGVEVVDAVIDGRAHDALIEYAEENDVDLIVMGTHGKSGISRVLLGSTAEKVVRHSPVPVLTVRNGSDDA